MYTLLSGLYEQHMRKDQFYILILGLDDSGKTTLFERIRQEYTGKSNHVVPTVGLNMSSVPVQNVILTLWDLGGQQALQKLWASYYSQAHCVVFLVDATAPARFAQVQTAFAAVLDGIHNIPVLLLANKMDSPDACSITDIQNVFNKVAVGMDARDSKVLAISALNGDGISAAVEWVITRVKGNATANPPV